MPNEGKLCTPCERMGRKVLAHRILPSGGGRCDEHWRQELGMPPLHKNAMKEEPTMAARLSEEKKAQIRADHAAGLNIETIRKKHHTSWPTVKSIVETSAATAPKPNGGLSTPPQHEKRQPNGNGIVDALEHLRLKREQIDRAIAALEEIGSQ